MNRFSTLPRWLSFALVGLLVFHFSMIGLFQFGKGRLPGIAIQLIDRYNLPWFYQNYLMFAPDPVNQIHTFVYRVETEDGWTRWKNPVYPYQQDHWANRFSSGSDMYDMFNGIADALFNGAHFASLQENSSDSTWFAWPGFALAERYVLHHSPYDTADIKAYQVGVITEFHRIDDQGRVHQADLFQSYPMKTVER